jgi:hypothetical protein
MRLTGILILDILLTVLYAFIIMILFNVANMYFLRKHVINKWIMLAIALVMFGGTLALLYFYPNSYWHLIPFTLSLFSFLWFIDLRRRKMNQKPEKEIVIKPKPKPNRAKQLAKANASKKEEEPRSKPSGKK